MKYSLDALDALGDRSLARPDRIVLIVGLDSLIRASSNPFFPFMLERIEADIGPRPAPKPGG